MSLERPTVVRPQPAASGPLPGPVLTLQQPLLLQSGVALAPVTIAYQTYGKLNEAASNCVLLCHALTGDQFVAGTHPVTGKDGWWDDLVGPGRMIDTDRFFVVCANVLGGCMGSTGPKEINPETGKPWGLTRSEEHTSELQSH